jgi:hypothetical protein
LPRPLHVGHLADVDPAALPQAAPELQAAFRLLQCLWNKHYEATWESLRAFEWSPEVAPLVEALAARLQAETLQLLGQAYVCIHPSKAASLLGVAEQAATSRTPSPGTGARAALLQRRCATLPRVMPLERLPIKHRSV